MRQAFTKTRPDAPDGFFSVEAAGLRWLAEAEDGGGARVVRPVEVSRTRLTLERLTRVAPDRGMAHDFGQALARTHRCGADRFGAPPGDWPGDGFIGPLPLPHTVPGQDRGWGAFYAELRLLPYARRAADNGAVDTAGLRDLERLADRLRAGDPALTGPDEPVARLHGDLWSGNVMWTPDGVVLIDPAAHGGHRETDLAMLALFGLPYLDEVLDGYQSQWPLAEGWRNRRGLHHLHPLLVHAALFGAGYGLQAVTVARSCLRS
jgi:fructosamine-3-kinase